MKHFRIIVCLLTIVMALPSYSQGLKAFKLKNGMSVYIWEDHTKTKVSGIVGVRAGSINDPEQYTGLAHYLEHLMFKGTQKIGTLNWAEEEPLYQAIIAKYDEMADETDQAKKDAINKEINELTIKAAEVSVANEFSHLMEHLGDNINAYTTFDYTAYESSIAPYQVQRWLEIASQRFINPVFRTFQTELETVYEEYNRGQDNPYRQIQRLLFEKSFEGHPYTRDVLGLPEHLKNPRISQLIKFYEDWYTPENMVLVLVGNVNAQEISGRIASTFGRLPAKKTPERKTYPNLEFKGRTQHVAKIGPSPSVMLIFNGVPAGHPDEYALDIALALLSNSNSTGLLNKLSIDGEIAGGGASIFSFREQGRCIISANPLYDSNQRRFESNRSTERKIMKAVEGIAKGEFEEWVIEAIKNSKCQNFDRNLEMNEDVASLLLSCFVNEENLEEVLNYKEIIQAVTVEDVKRVAKQYLSNNYLALHVEKGKSPKKEKMKKPGYAAIEPPVGKESLYAMQFKNMPIGQVEEKFLDFSSVQSRKINDRSNLFYNKNEVNEVFNLIIRYGVGTNELPNLGIAANLMNNAGVMGAYSPTELKQEFSKLGVSARVHASDDYLTISMSGYENHLPEACQLLTRQILMPQLDEKQLNMVIGNTLSNRATRKDNSQVLGSALAQYIRYKDKSSYIDEVTDKAIVELAISSLTGDINRASNYEAEIHYTGTLPFEDVYTVLSQNLPLVANEKPSLSPQVKPFAPVTENTVYFLPNTDSEQTQIYFFMPTTNYDTKDNAARDAFNQYFGAGFNGMVIDELRHKRSMVYTAHGVVVTPTLLNHPTYLTGQIGTQHDKALEALTIYMNLLENLPANPERWETIKTYLRQDALTRQPEMREKSLVIEYYKRLGYKQDPAIDYIPAIDALTFEDMLKYYQENVKGKPIVIGVMGNPKDIDEKALGKFGKVVRVNDKRLFNTKDTFF